MSAEWEDEAAQDFAQTIFEAMMCGATTKAAVRVAYDAFFKNCKLIPYSFKGTPRLPQSKWRPLRDWVLERDGYVCTYCGDDTVALCADHVVPLSRNGSNEEDNLVSCCIPCNTSKRDRLLSEWRGRYQ